MQKQVEPMLKGKLENYKKAINNIEFADYRAQVESIKQIIKEINQKEEKLNSLIEKKNELEELENELRHIQKKNEIYHVKEYEQTLKRNRTNIDNVSKLKKQLDILSKILALKDKNLKINLFDKFLAFIRTGQNISVLEKDGILIHLLLEEKYLTKLIEVNKQTLENEDFEELKSQIAQLYKKQYIPTSEAILKQTIKQKISIKAINEILEIIENTDTEIKDERNKTPIIHNCKQEILDLYPVVLTTVDSVISNYKQYFENEEKIDYVIIDEASQCDILSALPLLYLAKKIIVVGDSKQLTAITDIKENDLYYTVGKEYRYDKENFLSTITQTMSPHSEMLLEHYRCDYKIINYCNKYFYDNKLKIYKDSKPGAIMLLEADKGKYVKIEGHSYKNEREIKSIDSQMEGDIEEKFIITPFKRASYFFTRKV